MKRLKKISGNTEGVLVRMDDREARPRLIDTRPDTVAVLVDQCIDSQSYLNDPRMRFRWLYPADGSNAFLVVSEDFIEGGDLVVLEKDRRIYACQTTYRVVKEK